MKRKLAASEPEIQRDELGEFVIYNTDDGRTQVQLRLIDGTVWMTQAEMAELFDVARSSVSEHLKSIFNSGELRRERVVRKFRKVQGQGIQNRSLDHYNLDAIMAVGFRVRGPRGNQFRSWASSILQDYLIKGFVLNDEKLKDPRGVDYFDELLERIRDIRSNEARLYLELRNIVSLADDYDKDAPRTHQIYATIQDKLHYAITCLTASEIIATRSDAAADNLGLTSWKGKRVSKRDVTVAKNYLTADELRHLNLLVSQFLDYAQFQAESRKVIHMSDWLEKTDRFIEFNEREPLKDRGRITRSAADRLAGERYELFSARRQQEDNAELEDELLAALAELDRRLLQDRQRLQPRNRDS
ncbi:RhuM family protein [Corynebacterium sp. Q4381]|uniref:RhuM family protein n=1 Tax=Corynebacterium sp. Marseille-Q4381 TaxID=3121597 RepID=UPI002FE660F7